jgi:predicted PurR-regulated permease PerM
VGLRSWFAWKCSFIISKQPSPVQPTGLGIKQAMELGPHLRLTGTALKHWAIAQIQDSIAVGILWCLGLYIIRVPWAPLWAVLAAALQIVPHLGPVLSLIGPVLAAWISSGSWERPLYVLTLYAVIVVIDGFFLQPYLMRRTAKVPMWASILTPIAMGIVIPFWGVLLAPPLLAVLYAYKARGRNGEILPPPTT